MANSLDGQAGTVPEVTYGTPLTVTRFYEIDPSNTKHSQDPGIQQGMGLRVGSRFARSDRRAATQQTNKGTLETDVFAKGLGTLLNAAMGGNGVSTLVSGSTFQQLFTSVLTGSLAPSLTLQLGVVRTDAGGTVDAYTYAGTTITKWTLTQETGGFLRLSVEWDATTLATATGLATASYVTVNPAFHFGMASATYGGTVTAPTTTALASGGTALTNVRNFTLEVDNGLDIERWKFGGTRNQPRMGRPKATIKCTAEYDGVVFRDALIAQTANPFSITWSDTATALSTGFATFQIIAQATKTNPNDFAPPTDGTTTVDLELEVLEPATGAALTIATRTSDTTL
jgi:Phage tail tube protein